MRRLKGSPTQGLIGATLGFFGGFAAVALFGPMAHRLQTAMSLSPVALGVVVAAPMLSGSLLRIPFAAWVDTTGGRKPFLVLLILSILGMAGLLLLFKSSTPAALSSDSYPLLLTFGVLSGCGIATFSVGISQVSYWFPQSDQGRALGTYAGLGNIAPGIFSFLLPLALTGWGLAGAYWAWLIFLLVGTLLYALVGSDAWYFQLRRQGLDDENARRLARARGQQIFPHGGAFDGLKRAANRWRTWALVTLYFVSFGGFLGLTAWLPMYWNSYFAMTPATAGFLTALYALGASLIRIAGGRWSDRYGGERIATLALAAMLAGATLMALSTGVTLSIFAELLLAIGMGVNNAAVFKLVPKYVPDAVGGASGWVGGLGAFGGFLIPPGMQLFVQLMGPIGYARGFIVFAVLAAISLLLATILRRTSTDLTARRPIPDREAQIA